MRHRSQNILVEQTGVIGTAKEAKTILECWKCFINDSILEKILQHTNEYIEIIRPHYIRERDARFTDMVELKAFIGLLYLAGVFHANRMNLEDLWGKDNFGVEMFRLVMSLKRFKFLLRVIRFDDRTTRAERRSVDKLAAIRDVFSVFVDNCKNSYSPGQNVTIDEMLAGFRGRCSFRQYIPSKPNKYGIKIFSLVDAEIWYTHNLEIYPGKQPEGPFETSYKPSDVVKRLSEPIYGTGRNITADNWFTDTEVVNFLKNKKLSYVGTIKKINGNYPPNSLSPNAGKKKQACLVFKKMQQLFPMFQKKIRTLY